MNFIQDIFVAGGWVSYPLVVVGWGLSYMLTLRYFHLQKCFKRASALLPSPSSPCDVPEARLSRFSLGASHLPLLKHFCSERASALLPSPSSPCDVPEARLSRFSLGASHLPLLKHFCSERASALLPSPSSPCDVPVTKNKMLYSHWHLLEKNIELDFGRSFIKSLVVVAPLLGLLGTVVGMIETFDSLDGMQMHTSTGGIAGGIAQAMFTTEMGLLISIPGLLISRWLDRQQNLLLSREVQQLARWRQGVE